MKKKRFIALAMSMVLGTTLTGCSSSKDITDETVTVSVNKPVGLLEYYVEEPKTKDFEVGEHVFFKRYYSIKKDGNNIYSKPMYSVLSGSIDVPDGYQIIAVNAVSEGVDRTNTYDAVDIWFVNTDKVLVEPVYNEKTGCYDYSDFGMVMIDLIDYGESYGK